MIIAQRRMDYPQHPRERPGVLLWIFIGLSILLHALAFYAFHVVYPEPQPYLARSASIVMVQPRTDWSPEMRTWMAEEDPSLLTRHRWNLGTHFNPGVYQPIWELEKPELQDIAPLDFAAIAGGARMGPDLQDLLRAPRVAGTSPGQGPGSPAVHALRTSNSRLEFRWPEEPRQLIDPPHLALSLPLDSTLQPPEFFLGITSAGRVTHILTRRSSSLDEADALIRAKLRNLRFHPRPPGENPATDLSWGHVRVHFGGEAFN